MWNGRIHRQFYLFYSQPTAPFETKGARIGVAVTKSLAKPAWTDLGTIIATSDDTDFNTIDPAPYYELDPANPEVMISTPTRIAGGNGFGIEASYPLYRNGWFYLFANWDLCCRGGLRTSNKTLAWVDRLLARTTEYNLAEIRLKSSTHKLAIETLSTEERE
jgi:hypothetical protein